MQVKSSNSNNKKKHIKSTNVLNFDVNDNQKTIRITLLKKQC